MSQGRPTITVTVNSVSIVLVLEYFPSGAEPIKIKSLTPFILQV